MADLRGLSKTAIKKWIQQDIADNTAEYGIDGHNTGNIVAGGDAQCNGQNGYPIHRRKLCVVEIGVSAVV